MDDQVPENYLRAIFGSYLASRFVYEYGISASQFAFFALYVAPNTPILDVNKYRANSKNSMNKRIAKVRN